jgi:mRNA-degrading endonuclease RelE of RelBE toxin-antitoxin system
MSVVIQTTETFRKHLARLASGDRASVKQSVDRLAHFFTSDRQAFNKRVSRPMVPKLKGGFHSSLYVARAGLKLRVILAADDDPLFDRSIVTLIAIARHDESRKAFENAANWLYSTRLEGLAES